MRGGLWSEADNAVISNCVISDNTADANGGGAFRGVLYNCVLTGNRADFTGGGACGSELYNCTLTGNSAIQGGGIYYGTLCNCIVYYNQAPLGANWFEGNFDHTCSTPSPPGLENFTNAPGIVSVNHPFLLAGSPCINAGGNQPWMLGATDVEGELRTNGIADVGADEYWGSARTGSLSVAIWVPSTQAVVGLALPFEARITGQAEGYVWNFGDGMRATNLCEFTHAYSSNGNFVVTLTASNFSGSAATAVTLRIVTEANYYVATNGNDLAEGANWATAKATLQTAIDAAIPGATIWVSNGVYAAGGVTNYPAGSGLTNRVAIYKPIAVRSIHGPSETSILGRGPAGSAAIRCVYMTAGASLIGFTLADGHTWTNGDYYREQSGGGLWSESQDTVISNCVFIRNYADADGGGALIGTLDHCALMSNSAAGSGGGTYGCKLFHSTLMFNSADAGGGSCEGALSHCALMGNSASMGGGTYWSSLNNCTLTSNRAVNLGGGGGGRFHVELRVHG